MVALCVERIPPLASLTFAGWPFAAEFTRCGEQYSLGAINLPSSSIPIHFGWLLAIFSCFSFVWHFSALHLLPFTSIVWADGQTKHKRCWLQRKNKTKPKPDSLCHYTTLCSISTSSLWVAKVGNKLVQIKAAPETLMPL